MLDADFITAIADLKAESMTPTVIHADSEPKNVYYLHNPQKSELTRVEGPRPAENRLFTNLESLVKWGWSKPNPKAWVSIEKIQVTTEDDFQSLGIYPIGLSPQATTMIQLAKTEQTLDQKQMIRLLRSTFNGCVPQSLITLFQQLKFTRNQENATTLVVNQSANIGKLLTASVLGVEAIPDTVTFDLPMTADPFLLVDRQKVRVGLDVDLDAGKFLVFVLPLEMERAVKATVDGLRELAADEIKPKLNDRAIMSVNTMTGATGADDIEGFPVYVGKVV